MILLYFFLLHCFLQCCAFLAMLKSGKKKKGNLVKAEHVRVFHLIGIPSQWASHTNSLLSNFQKDSMFSGVENLQYVS